MSHIPRHLAATGVRDAALTGGAAEAGMAPVHTMLEVLADPHVQERGVFVEVDGVVMQGPVARFSRTPAEMRWAGRTLGADTDEVLNELEHPDA